MPPEHLKFGGGPVETVLHPAVLLLVFIAGVFILARPRREALAAFIAVSILIPMDQVLVIGGLHFPMLRLLALFGIVRIVRAKISGGKIFSGSINKIDIAVIAFTIFTAIAGVALFQESGAVIFQFGNIYTVFGIYFLFRLLVRDRDDVVVMVRTLAWVAMLIAVAMTWELVTRHNPYAVLGGARASSYANVGEHDGRMRATACFGHPILAGTFGAIVLPMFVLLWREGKKNRGLAVTGMIASTVIVLTANSSTPVLAYMAGVIALCLWPLRNWLRVFRWGIALSVIGLHLVMKAPVWHLVSRIDVSGESSSYHRYQLIDQCIRHFGDWWLIGVKSTADWGWDMWDTANQYVGTCEASGLLPFILFLASIVYGFHYLGRARKTSAVRNDQILLWALGSALFANAVAFFGISYWDQTQVVWYGLLAAISAAALMSPSAEGNVARLVAEKSIEWVEFAASTVEGENDIAELDPLPYQSQSSSIL